MNARLPCRESGLAGYETRASGLPNRATAGHTVAVSESRSELERAAAIADADSPKGVFGETESREALAALAEEQAALRRVAALAARELAPADVFVAVTEEAARALKTEAVGMLRFEQDESATLVAQSQTPWDPPPLGTRFTLEGENVVAWVHRTGQTRPHGRLDERNRSCRRAGT